MKRNTITPPAIERLAWASEELAEAMHMIGKSLRHGLDSSHPDYQNELNRDLLAREMGHVLAAFDLLMDADVLHHNVELSRITKRKHVRQYLHHEINRVRLASFDNRVPEH